MPQPRQPSVVYPATYGPNAATGEIGAELGVSGAGQCSMGSGVGFFYYSLAEQYLLINVQASVRGHRLCGGTAWLGLCFGIRHTVPDWLSLRLR